MFEITYHLKGPVYGYISYVKISDYNLCATKHMTHKPLFILEFI